MVAGKHLIIVSCLWQSYDHWHGQHEYDLIPKINSFTTQARPYADIMWANDHMDEISQQHHVMPQDLKFSDTVSIVQQYEQGRAVPDPSVITKMEQTLGCKLPRK